MKKFKNANKRLSYKILNRRIDQYNNRNRETFKDAHFKNFRFKLMINELPVLEKLKIRYKYLYNKELECIRCNRKRETLHHLWECDKETNNIIKFERIIKKWLYNRIHNIKIFKEIDNLLDELYKYIRFTVTLRHLNTKENTEIYRRLNPFDKRLTYIWDKTESMDDLIRGWVPNKLLNILKQKKIKGSMKDIKELLSD